MDYAGGCFTMSGTQIERGPGRLPLLAVEQWDAAGGLMRAVLVDPEAVVERPLGQSTEVHDGGAAAA